jgi:uncharacterized protein
VVTENLPPSQFQPRPGERVFLSAEWRDLVMLNYQVDPLLLGRYVPPGTELDGFAGGNFLTLVGFRFLGTKLWGLAPVPFHRDFEEVNLRLYVRRSEAGESRRGVVFIREIVPRWAISLTARLAYGEHYSSHAMRHSVNLAADGGQASYEWRLAGQWCRLEANATGAAICPEEGTFEQFITEHYWGYSAGRGRPLEYRVAHEPWRVWASSAARFCGHADSVYGPQLAEVLRRRPDSAFIAEGSRVSVFTPRPLS